MLAKNMFLNVLVVSVLALVLGIYLSTFKNSEYKSTSQIKTGFPWQIEILPSGNSRVFGLIIGQSTLGEAEQSFKEASEITLFVSKESAPVIEAYFSQVKIAGLNSKMVMSIELPQQQIETMLNRGARIATLESGTREVTLSSDDAQSVRQLPVSAITYLPSIHLDEAIIERRFGLPSEKIADPESDAVHWLYPSKGLDIALSAKNKEVIQYVNPEKFDTLLQPLREAAVSE